MFSQKHSNCTWIQCGWHPGTCRENEITHFFRAPPLGVSLFSDLKTAFPTSDGDISKTGFQTKGISGSSSVIRKKTVENHYLFPLDFKIPFCYVFWDIFQWDLPSVQ